MAAPAHKICQAGEVRPKVSSSQSEKDAPPRAGEAVNAVDNAPAKSLG